MSSAKVFNSLQPLSEANKVLAQRLAVLGDRSDLAELKAIFQKFGVTEKIGLIVLHRHFLLNEGEKVVEFGHVSTPWPVPDTAGNSVSGGHLVPRSWRFLDHQPVPYEYGFNHPGQEEYEDLNFPEGFTEEVDDFLSDTRLDEVLGLCVIGAAEVEGRIEKTRGRVNFTVPPCSLSDLDVSQNTDFTPSVWSFDCKSGLRDATMTLARVCYVCAKH